MKKIFLYLFITGLALLMFTGCPTPLTTNLPFDIVITIGRFNPTANSTLYGAADGTLSVPVTISDQTGRALTGDYTVAFTLSVDADLTTTGDNTDLGTFTIAAGSEQIIDITVPGTVAAAVYTIFAAVSEAGDTVINNNTASGSADIGAANQPNLVITSLETGNDMGGYWPGATGTLIYKIQNTGYAAIASGISFEIRFAVDLVIPDTEIGTHTVTLEAPLYPQGFITGTADFATPTAALLAAANTPPETEETFTEWLDQLTATVDSGTDIAETDETDNEYTALWIGSGSQKPELDVTSVIIAAGTEYAKTDNPLEYSVEITNTGYATASGYSVALFADIDGDGTNNAGDAALYTWDAPATVPFDAAGNGHNTVILSVPAGEIYPATADGTYWVRAVITGLTEEWDDTDNTSNNGQSESVTFVTTAYDLEMYRMVTSLTAAVDEAAGGSVPITYTIYNSGEDALTTDFTVHFYASDDGNLTPAGDIDLLTDTVTDTIPGNGKTTVSHTLTFPAGEGAEFYTLYWVLDETDTVAEFNEGNNTATNADECFVFFIVSSGATINSKIIIYKPLGAPVGDSDMYVYLYRPLWSEQNHAYLGTPSDFGPGELAGTCPFTLNPAVEHGIQFQLRDNNLDYCFRFVPNYVFSVPQALLPYALQREEASEPNDTQDTAAELSGTNNPLYSFVTGYSKYSYYKDYYKFSF